MKDGLVQRDLPAYAGDGSTPAETSLAPMQHLRDLTRIHSEVLHDATPLRRDELAQTADELAQLAEYLVQVSVASSEFMSKVSHELRTPLTIAKGWMNMLRCGELLPQQQRVVTVIDQQLDELTRLVNDLLDLSRREAGGLQLRLESMDLVTLVEEIAEHQRELTSLQGIQLIVRTQAAEAYARVDRGRIAQVLNNLINNACRYVQHFGNGKIILTIIETPTAVQISVRDNGIGIEPEHLPRIFEPFYQIQRRNRGKSGLGLALAQELVQEHNGSLTVESTLGQGTVFHIWLPRATKDEG